MKLKSLSVLFLLTALAAQADVVMVKGTIYDVGKGSHSKQDSIPDKRDDSNLCWAATCSNLFQHWQDRYLSRYQGCQAPNGTQEGYSQPSGTRYLKIYDLFRENFKNRGGDMGNAVRWYFNGDDTNVNGLADNWSHAGYYEGYGIDTARYVFNPKRTGTGTSYIESMGSFSKALDQAFYREGVGVFLTIVTSEGGSHAISCWGYETNANNELVALYITDSDDVQFGARRVEVEMRDGYVHFSSPNPTGSYYVGNGAEYIDEVWFLKPPASNPGMFTFNTDNIKLTSSLIAKGPIDKAVDATGEQVTSAKGITLAAGSLLSAAGNSNTKISLGASSGMVEGSGLVVEAGSMLNLRDGAVTISHFAGDGLVVGAEAYLANNTVTISGNGGTGVLLTSAVSDNRTYLGLTDNKAVTISDNNKDGIRVEGSMDVARNTLVTIDNNTGTGISVVGTEASLYRAGDGKLYTGAALEVVRNTTVEITNNKQSGISVQDGNGTPDVEGKAPVYAASLVFDDNGTIRVEGNSNVSGGGALVKGDLMFCNNTNVSFAGNTATANGGAIAALWEGYQFGAASITGNKSVKFENNTADGAGGALFVSGAVDISGNTVEVVFDQNKSKGDGGAIHVGSCGSFSMQDNASVTLSGNKAVNGSAIYSTKLDTEGYLMGGYETNVTLTDNTILDIKDNVSSGADVVYNQGDVLSISKNGSVEFSGNDAGSGSVIHNARNIVEAGGGYYTITINPVVEIANNGAVTFSNNEAKYDILNEHVVYLCAGENQSITFQHGIKNETAQTINLEGGIVLESPGGVTYIGQDAAGNESTGGTYVFTDGQVKMTMADAHGTVGAGGGIVLENGCFTISEAAITSALTVDLGNYLAGNTLTMTNVTLGSGSSLSLALGLDAEAAQTFSLARAGSLTETTVTLSDYLTLEGTDLTGVDLSLTVAGKLTDGTALVIDTEGLIAADAVTVTGYNLDRTADGKLYYSAKPASDQKTPEPTTTTLSLLALAALCARRRRR